MIKWSKNKGKEVPMGIHGGNIYEHPGVIDFSANCNCYGMPDRVRGAAVRGVEQAAHYPDPQWSALREAIGAYEQVDPAQILCGNGASELLAALMRALRPRRALLIAPGFYEYERALEQVGAQITFYQTQPESGWQPGEAFLDLLRSEAEPYDVVMLSNPNNPTGALLAPEYIRRLVQLTADHQIRLVLDECFIEFMADSDKYSGKQYLQEYPHLVIVKAFTKTYACAGLRIGYVLGSDHTLLCNCKKELPEWNVSLPAAYAGIAATQERAWLREMAGRICTEREWLRGQLEAMGCVVFPAAANYLFFMWEQGVYEYCLSHGILIRDCSNYRGLGNGAYRVCVRTREENEQLLAVLAQYQDSLK